MIFFVYIIHIRDRKFNIIHINFDIKHGYVYTFHINIYKKHIIIYKFFITLNIKKIKFNL